MSSASPYGHFLLGFLNVKEAVCYRKCVNELTIHAKETIGTLYWHLLVLLARIFSNRYINIHFNYFLKWAIFIFISLSFYTYCFKAPFAPNHFLAASSFRDCNPILPEHFLGQEKVSEYLWEEKSLKCSWKMTSVLICQHTQNKH